MVESRMFGDTFGVAEHAMSETSELTEVNDATRAVLVHAGLGLAIAQLTSRR